MIFNYGRSGGGAKFEYTGDYTTEDYTGTDGTKYKLYTLTSTGTATVKAKSADIWLCGGGSNGLTGSAGGAGAYCASAYSQPLDGEYLVTIGAGNGGATSFASLVSANGVANSKSGGSGGGGMDISSGYRYSAGGSGDGIAKYPFGDSAYFKCPCAGGGGGYIYVSEDSGNRAHGIAAGAGGTNGSNGKNGNSGTDGAGGVYGGGNGGGRGTSGSSATFYGSGGGGGGYEGEEWLGDLTTLKTGTGGAGYQGVVYVRIPA